MVTKRSGSRSCRNETPHPHTTTVSPRWRPRKSAKQAGGILIAKRSRWFRRGWLERHDKDLVRSLVEIRPGGHDELQARASVEHHRQVSDGGGAVRQHHATHTNVLGRRDE